MNEINEFEDLVPGKLGFSWLDTHLKLSYVREATSLVDMHKSQLLKLLS